MPSPSPLPPRPLAAGEALVVGWKEYVGLPELGIPRLKAKVDTGARTSALHVESLAVVSRCADGSGEIRFAVPLGRREPVPRVQCSARMLGETRVTDSGGASEVRPLIATELVLGPVRKRILLTLTDRSGMLFRMLLGRTALEGDFLVDVGHKYLLRAVPAAAPAASRRATSAKGRG